MCPVPVSVPPVRSVHVYLAPPPRCHVLLVDLGDESVRAGLRHELFWHRAALWGRMRQTDAAGHDPYQGNSPLFPLPKQADRDAVTTVARIPANQTAFAGQIDGFDHVAVLSDADMANPAQALRDQLGLPPDAMITQTGPVHPTGAALLARAIWRACRPHHWIKNLLVFVPLLAAHQVTGQTLGQALLAFLAFCAVASGVYLLNDLLDLRADRAHPRKRLRPFASGDLPLTFAPVLLAGTFGTGLVLASVTGGRFAAFLGLYALLTLAYSLGMKRVAIADIAVLAALYTLRIVAGGVATGITLSVWLLAFAMFLFLALAATKRLAELAEVEGHPQANVPGRGYSQGDLPLVMMLAVAAGHVAVLILALYVNSPDVGVLYANPAGLWLACLALYLWTMRLVLMARRGQIVDDPVVHATRDPASWACALLLAGAVIWASLGGWPASWLGQGG